MHPPAGQAAHQRQQAAVPLLPHEQQRQHQHGRQQNQVGEGVGNRGVKPFLRVVINGRFAQAGIDGGCDLNVFQIIAALVVLEDRDARQLGRLGLYTVQKIGVPGHRVVLTDQLGEQRVVQRKAVGVQSIRFVKVDLFPGVKQIGIFLPVVLQIDAVAIGKVAVIVIQPQQRLGLVELVVQKVALGGHI